MRSESRSILCLSKRERDILKSDVPELWKTGYEFGANITHPRREIEAG